MRPPKNPYDDIEDRNRLLVAIILVMMIVIGYQVFFQKPHEKSQGAEKSQQVAMDAAATHILPRAQVLSESTRIPIKGQMVVGSLSLKGLRLDDLRLVGQFVSEDSEELVPLFNPSGTEHAFYAESGWLSDDKNIKLPSQDTVWKLASSSPSVLESGKPPVVLQWDNGQGLVFERAVSLDDRYLFSIVQSVTNKTGASVVLNPYHLTARHGLPLGFSGVYTLHEGPVGYFGGKGRELHYDDLIKGEKTEERNTSGWLGIADKYWLAAILPAPSQVFDARVTGIVDEQGKQRFHVGVTDSAVTVKSGETTRNETWVFAGVKSLDAMNAYEEAHGFQRLDFGIDFGIWSFITKPFYSMFHIIVKFVGNVGLAILVMTVIVRAAMFPIAAKAYTSMARMKRLQPMMKELQTQYADDKTKLQQEMFSLYKREKVNPFSGCLPLLAQIPIFFALYKTILISVELRHAPFWGWIRDLSAPDPTSVFNLFGLIPWQPPQLLMIGGWGVLFCFTMIVQKRLSPPIADAVQEKMQSYFPYIVTFMMAHFASGLVIYWTWSNCLAILQQYYILKKVGGEKVSLIHGHHARRVRKKTRKKKA